MSACLSGPPGSGYFCFDMVYLIEDIQEWLPELHLHICFMLEFDLETVTYP